jgi:hypothetical protein
MRVGPSMWDPPSCEGLLYSFGPHGGRSATSKAKVKHKKKKKKVLAFRGGRTTPIWPEGGSATSKIGLGGGQPKPSLHFF